MKCDPLKILIVDDEPKIAEVVKSYLESSGYSALCAYNGSEAMELFNREMFSLIVLDLMLPDISGEELCRIFRRKSAVPIIMLTAKADEEDILKGLNLGADDYMTKPFSPRQLTARVSAVLRRFVDELAPAVGELSFNNRDLEIDPVRHEVRKSGKQISLTPKEYKILIALVRYPGRVYTRDELVCNAFGDDFDGFDRTIDTHIKNLRQKLENDPKNPVYILTIYGTGYRFGGE